MSPKIGIREAIYNNKNEHNEIDHNNIRKLRLKKD